MFVCILSINRKENNNYFFQITFLVFPVVFLTYLNLIIKQLSHLTIVQQTLAPNPPFLPS